MKRQNLVLVLMSMLLVVVISAEVVYLSSLNNKQSSVDSQEEMAIPTNTVRVPSENDLAKERTFNRLIDDVEKGYVDEVILSTYYAGSFIQYEMLSSAQDDRYVGGMKISIQVDTKEQDNVSTVIIPAKTASSMRVLKSVNDQLIPATLDDIKTGAIIKIQQDQSIIETDPVEAILDFTITIK